MTWVDPSGTRRFHEVGGARRGDPRLYLDPTYLDPASVDPETRPGSRGRGWTRAARRRPGRGRVRRWVLQPALAVTLAAAGLAMVGPLGAAIGAMIAVRLAKRVRMPATWSRGPEPMGDPGAPPQVPRARWSRAREGTPHHGRHRADGDHGRHRAGPGKAAWARRRHAKAEVVPSVGKTYLTEFSRYFALQAIAGLAMVLGTRNVGLAVTGLATVPVVSGVTTAIERIRLGKERTREESQVADTQRLSRDIADLKASVERLRRAGDPAAPAERPAPRVPRPDERGAGGPSPTTRDARRDPGRRGPGEGRDPRGR